MTVEEIVNKYASKLNNNWLRDKKLEFERSPFHQDGYLINDEKLIKDRINASFGADESDIYIDSIDYIVDESVLFNYSFEEFLVSSSSYYKNVHKLFAPDTRIEEGKGNGVLDPRFAIYRKIKKIDDLDTISRHLAKDIFEFAESNIPISGLEDYLKNVTQVISESISDLSFFLDTHYGEYFMQYYQLNISEFFRGKLDSVLHYNGDDSLRFNLNLEGLTALLSILLGARVFESDTELKRFALKYFRIKMGDQTFQSLNSKSFNNRMSKQTGSSHRANSLEEIVNKIQSSYDDILKIKG
jgi:hypothetical protein